MAEIPPYGVAIRSAAATGDLEAMKKAVAAAERHVAEHGDISAALELLKIEIAKREKHG